MLYHFDVMIHGLLAYMVIGVAQRTKLVGVLLVGLILKGIGVNRINRQSVFCQQLLDRCSVPGDIPGNV